VTVTGSNSISFSCAKEAARINKKINREIMCTRFSIFLFKAANIKADSRKN